MKLVNRKTIEIGITKSGQWYWKPTWSGMQDNFHRINNGKDFKFINTWSYYVPVVTQLFFLRFIFYIKIKPEIISGDSKFPSRYVPIEDTHLSLDDTLHGSWDGRPVELGATIYK